MIQSISHFNLFMQVSIGKIDTSVFTYQVELCHSFSHQNRHHSRRQRRISKSLGCTACCRTGTHWVRSPGGL